MAATETILLIDDEPDYLAITQEILTEEGFNCVGKSSAASLPAILEELQPSVVLTDLRMPGLDGRAVIRLAHEYDPQLPVIVLTGENSIAMAVELTREGAFDYLTKPVDPDQLLLRVTRALEQNSLRRENTKLREALTEGSHLDRMIGHSAAMQRIYTIIKRVAPSDVGIFIQGESGTGKELVARALHTQSTRADRPFMPIDCVALPAQLVESELFGHEKGAFTGANSARQGLLESAEDGTVFLDEITELAIDLQAKLLRVLQEKQFRRVGGRDFVPLRARIVAATNRDPEQAVADGVFREDLFYRLNVVPIHLPPLRRRREDIPLLLEHFLRRQQSLGIPVASRFTPEAMKILQSFHWPGNIRQLENLVQRLALLSIGDAIDVGDLPPELTSAPPTDDAALGGLLEMPFKEARGQWLEMFERRYVEGLLQRHDGNISKAAQEAGIDRKTIHRILNDQERRDDDETT